MDISKYSAEKALEIITNAVQTENITVEQDKALSICQKALYRQIPRMPQKSDSGMFYICPNCSRFIEKYEKPYGNNFIPHCKWCGQKLDWSDNSDNGRSRIHT